MRQIPASKPHQQGFTFIEVIVAVGILAVVGISSAMLLINTVDQGQRLEEHGRQLIELNVGLNQLRRDLEQAVPRYYRDRHGSRQVPFSGFGNGETLLDFIRAGKRANPAATATVELERVRYRLAKGQLLRHSSNILDGTEEPQWITTTLLNNVRNVSLVFYFDGSWQSEWSLSPSSRDEVEIPRAVSIRFETPTFGRVEQKILLLDSQQ